MYFNGMLVLCYAIPLCPAAAFADVLPRAPQLNVFTGPPRVNDT